MEEVSTAKSFNRDEYMGTTSGHIENSLRLNILHQTALLDSPPEEALDRLTRLATKVLGVQISLVSLVDKDRQFFKSAVGLAEPLASTRQTPLTHSFCKFVVQSGKPVIVSDARLYPVPTDSPVVPLFFVAYAGIPPVTSDGSVLGSFCAMDIKPHEWTPDQIELLRCLTASAITEIELRRANKAKDRFIAMLSHDLRIPLSPALLIAAELAADPNLPEPLRSDVKLIHRNIELEVRMIDSLLDLTRINHGKLCLHVEDIDVHEVLRASAAMCAIEASAKDISVRLDLRACRSAIRGDPVKLQQMFCNLLKNAIKFSGSNGEIIIGSSDGLTEQLSVTISDKGIGIAAEAMSHIFDPFDQGEFAVAQRFGGLGLGLAICKGIVEAHGGSISASSAGRGEGTMMTVVLPLVTETQCLREVPASVERQLPLDLKILLVDDHEDSLHALSRSLRRLEYQVTTAISVSAALSAAAVISFDLLISDVRLPDGTGLQLMRELMAQHPIKGIAITGYGMESDIARTKQAGFQRHLTKPVSFHDLHKAIQEIAW